MFYSRKENGFFDGAFAPPADSVEVTPQQYASLIGMIENGGVLSADDNGFPVVTPFSMTEDDLRQNATIIKNAKIDDAMQKTQLWQIELSLGVISDNDKASLAEWVAYIKLIQSISIDDAISDDFSWPVAPQ